MLKIKNKPVRVAVKLLLYFFGFVILLFAAISIYVETNKKQLLEQLRKGVNQNLRSEIKYRDADITIWQNFPFIAVRFYDISIEDSTYHMPFFRMKEVAGQISLLQYFRKTIELRDVYCSDGVVHLFTDSSGYTNKYLLKYKKKEGTAAKKEVMLNHATFKNVQVILENRQRNKLFDFLFKSLYADISKSGEDYDIGLSNKAIINNMAFNLARGSYLKGQSIDMDIDLHIDRKKAELSFNEERFKVDGHSYFMKGKFIMKGDGYFNLDVHTEDAPYEKLRHIFAENIATKLGQFNIENPLDVKASLEGPLAFQTTPKVLATWKVKDNVLTTAVAKFTNCSFTGAYTNEKVKGNGFTDPNSEIVLNTFTGNWEGISLNGKDITVTNLTNPYLSFSLTSSTDFKTLNNKLGLKTIELLQGQASLNLSYVGPIEKDISVLDRMNGQLTFSNGTIRYIPRGFTFNNCSGNVFFSDNNIKVDNLKCDLNKTHFVVNVSGNNMSGLTSADQSKTSISCNVYSPLLNVAELSGLFSKKKAVAATKSNTGKLIHTASSVDNIMDNGNLAVSIKAGAVQFKRFTGQNLNGSILFSNNDLYINNVSLSHANGSMNINGEIKQSENSNTASAKINLQNVDVKKLFYAFNNFGQDGIASDNIQGTLNSTANVSLIFDEKGLAVPGSIKGMIDFSLVNGALINYEPLQDIKKSIFKNKDMSHVTFAELKNKFEVDGYQVKINKMEIQSSAIGMFVDGLYDIKKDATKINIQVPLKGLKRDSTYNPENIGVDAKKGLSVYLEGKTDKKTGKVKFGLNTTKTIRKIF
jgi:hypothetical protein